MSVDLPKPVYDVECVAKTDPGRDPDKQVNEDSYRHARTRFGELAVVCDGMGGHAGGQEASRLAVATVFEEVEGAADGTSPGAALKAAIEVANRRVYALGRDNMQGRPGSTVVAALFHDQGVEIAHVGDSRVYLVRGVECRQITRDHSAVQLMVDAGMLTAEQAKVHPEANKITRALGIEAEANVELRAQPLPYVVGDTLLLCSDGLSDLADVDDILRLVGGIPLGQAAGQLVDLANARGGHDNITVLLVRTQVSSTATTGAQTQLMPPVGAPGGGVAKTVLGMPAAVGGGVSPTVLMDAPSAPEGVPAHIPPAHRGGHEVREGGRASLVLGLGLAAAALVLLAGLLFWSLRDRAGHHKDRPPVVVPVSTSVPPKPAADELAPVDGPAMAPPVDDDDDANTDASLRELVPPPSRSSGGWPSPRSSSSSPSAPRPSPSMP